MVDGKDVQRFTVIRWGVVVAECASVAEVAAAVPVGYLREDLEQDEAPPAERADGPPRVR